MANTLLASALLSGGDDPASAVVVASPLADIWYNFDAAWGIGDGDAPGIFSTALSCPGATIDMDYGPAVRGHGAAVSGRVGIDLGWSPDGRQVYLTPLQAALGLWRLRFPSVGTYTIILSDFGTIAVTVAAGSPTATSPAIRVLHPAPLNRQPSKLLELTYSGIYPPGGLDLLPGQIGLTGILFADLNDDSTYRYTWSDGRLHAWTGSGEATGTVNLAMVGLFWGIVG